QQTRTFGEDVADLSASVLLSGLFGTAGISVFRRRRASIPAAGGANIPQGGTTMTPLWTNKRCWWRIAAIASMLWVGGTIIAAILTHRRGFGDYPGDVVGVALVGVALIAVACIGVPWIVSSMNKS